MSRIGELDQVKCLYLVRHCLPQGQAPSAALSPEGKEQAQVLAGFLGRLRVDRIVSSPYARALESIAPFSARTGIEIEVDERLVERVLSATPLDDWRERIRQSFEDLDAVVEGGESSRVAMQRASAALADVLDHPELNTVIVTHGNLMTLMLKLFDDRVGYAQWEGLTYPDVYSVVVTPAGAVAERLWGRNDTLGISQPHT